MNKSYRSHLVLYLDTCKCLCRLGASFSKVSEFTLVKSFTVRLVPLGINFPSLPLVFIFVFKYSLQERIVKIKLDWIFGADVINLFWSWVAMLRWNEALWLVFHRPMTIFSQSECFRSDLLTTSARDLSVHSAHQ